MTASAWLQTALFFGTVIICAKLLGAYMARV
jgi:hypothetical protein